MIQVRRNGRRRGATIVEAALVLPICLMILFGIIEYSRVLMLRQLLDNAAREGGRLAVVHTNDLTTADIQSAVLSRMGKQDGQLKNVVVSIYRSDATGKSLGLWTDAQFGEYIAVKIEGDFNPVTPSFLGMKSTVKLRGLVLMYSEAN